MSFNKRKHLGSQPGFNSGIFGKSSSGPPFVPSDYFLNFWATNDQLISGTTTTIYDQVGVLDMANIDVTSQPTYSDPYQDFDGVTDYLRNTVSNFRTSDTTGVVTLKVKLTDNTTKQNYLFCSADELTAKYIYVSYRNLKLRITFIGLTGGTHIVESNDALTFNQEYKISWYNTGSAIKLMVDGVVVGVNNVSGSYSGQWFNLLDTFSDNISLGAAVSLSVLYGKSSIEKAGYSAYTNEAAITTLQSLL